MKYIALFLIIGIIFSCNNDEENSTSLIGEDYIESHTKIYFIDTLTVNASTFMYDSLVVTNVNRLLIGAYQDDTFGKTRSRSYVQLENLLYDLEDNAVFDSISLVLNFDKYFYNDTIPTQQLKVYEVLERIEPDDEDDLYYNTTNFNYNPQHIGEKYFLPKPIKTDSLEIKLNDEYGANIFHKIKENDINNNSDFVDEIKGILIEANEDISTSVLGFSKDSFVRMYYTVDDDEGAIEKTIDFTFHPDNSFNQIESDKTGTYFEEIIGHETILPSSETDNSCFMQSGIGLVTRIDIPYIKSLKDIAGEGVVIDAKLKFSLKQNSFSNNLATHDSIQAFIIDRKAEVLSDLTLDGTYIKSNIINNDPEFETDIYALDIKPFVQLKEIETNEPYYLALYPQDFNSSLDRYIFNGDQFEDDLRMKLELTYVIYD